MMVQSPQTHNHEKYNNRPGWSFTFDDNNELGYKEDIEGDRENYVVDTVSTEYTQQAFTHSSKFLPHAF